MLIIQTHQTAIQIKLTKNNPDHITLEIAPETECLVYRISDAKNETLLNVRAVYFDYRKVAQRLFSVICGQLEEQRHNKKLKKYLFINWLARKFTKLFSKHFIIIWRNAHDLAPDTNYKVFDRRYVSVTGTIHEGLNREILVNTIFGNPYLKNDFLTNRAFVKFLFRLENLTYRSTEIKNLSELGLENHYFGTGIQDYEKALLHWRNFFSPDCKTYPVLHRILQTMPVHASRESLKQVSAIKHEKIFGKLGWYINHVHQCGHVNYRIVIDATDDQIKRVKKEYQWLIDKGYVTDNSKPRSAARLERIVNYLLDNPNKHMGNIVGLMEATKEWHKELALKREQRKAELDKQLAERTEHLKNFVVEDGFIVPEIPIPAEEFSPLLSKQALEEEGEIMGHCIAGYYGRRTYTYFWHVAYQGEHASVAVNQTLDGIQIQGVKNTNNRAVGYAEKVIQDWKKALLEYRGEKQEFFKDAWRYSMVGADF